MCVGGRPAKLPQDTPTGPPEMDGRKGERVTRPVIPIGANHDLATKPTGLLQLLALSSAAKRKPA